MVIGMENGISMQISNSDHFIHFLQMSLEKILIPLPSAHGQTWNLV